MLLASSMNLNVPKKDVTHLFRSPPIVHMQCATILTAIFQVGKLE